MATETDIETLRLLTDVSDDPPYTDEYLAALIDAEGTVDMAAVVVWRQKAAKLAGYVDTTESGSSRKLSQMHEQALKMADAQQGQVIVESGRSFTVGSERV